MRIAEPYVPETLRYVQDNYSDLLAKSGRREAATSSENQAVKYRSGLRRTWRKLTRRHSKTYGGPSRAVYQTLSSLLIDAGRLAEAQQVIDLLKEEEYFEFVRRDQRRSTRFRARQTIRARGAGRGRIPPGGDLPGQAGGRRGMLNEIKRRALRMRKPRLTSD